MEYYIFGYGSLVSKQSTERTLGRKLEEKTSDYCGLKGYRRIWNFKARVMTTLNEEIINAVFLNIMPCSSEGTINGFLFKVDKQELDKLKKRERNYDCVDVTDSIFDHKISLENHKVFTFSCVDDQYLSKPGDPTCFVLKNYDLLVNEAFKKVSESYHREYEETTVQHNYDFALGPYKGV